MIEAESAAGDSSIRDVAGGIAGYSASSTKQDQLDFAARHELSQLVEPGNAQIGAAVIATGAPRVLQALRRLELGKSVEPELAELRLPTAWNSKRSQLLAQEELEEANRLGVRFVVPATRSWPTQLNDLGSRTPLILRVKGSEPMRSLAIRGLGVVGARACTRYGQDITEEFSSRLAANDWTIVSGGAYGIDAAAHRGALAVGGRTIAISAAGVEQAIPASNASLFEAIAQNGVIVSEAPIGAHPTRSRFLVRNRLIAGLSRGVVVTEAALRSGSLSTAREASEIGRILMAVPGPVTSLSSAGGHGLIRDGIATLVTSHSDIIEQMKMAGGAIGAAVHTELDDKVINYLTGATKPRSAVVVPADDLASELKVALTELFISLASLESRQLIDRSSEGWSLVRQKNFS